MAVAAARLAAVVARGARGVPGALRGARDALGRFLPRRAPLPERVAKAEQKARLVEAKRTGRPLIGGSKIQRASRTLAAGGAGATGLAILPELTRQNEARGEAPEAARDEEPESGFPVEDANGGGDGAAHGGRNGRQGGMSLPVVPFPPLPAAPQVFGVQRVSRAELRTRRQVARSQARAAQVQAREATRQAVVQEVGAAVRQVVASLGDVLATAATHKPAAVVLTATPAAWLAIRALGLERGAVGASVAASMAGLSGAMLTQDGEQPTQKTAAPVVAAPPAAAGPTAAGIAAAWTAAGNTGPAPAPSTHRHAAGWSTVLPGGVALGSSPLAVWVRAQHPLPAGASVVVGLSGAQATYGVVNSSTNAMLAAQEFNDFASFQFVQGLP